MCIRDRIYQGHDRGYWVIEEGHRHPHQSDGNNELHEWYDELNEIIDSDAEPFEELNENE